ncbi:MAG: hypothetical protein ABIJ09_25820 [Pseudomonadota bacterium]
MQQYKGRNSQPTKPTTPAPVQDTEQASPSPNTGSEVRRKAVYSIKEGKEADKSYWTRVGVAFINKDDSLNVQLDCLPVDGRLHIRDFPDRQPSN